MFVVSECSIPRDSGTEQNRQGVWTALFAHLLRGIDRRLHHIFHHVLVDLSSLLLYINAGSHLQLVVGAFNSAEDAPARKYPSNIANKSNDVMKLKTPTVLEAMWWLISVLSVDNFRTVEQRVYLSFKIRMRVAFAPEAWFHA